MKHGKCRHRKGQAYDGKSCHAILDEPADAYEWSFVAVPAQRGAGVTKSFGTVKGGEGSLENILKSIRFGTEGISLSKADVRVLKEYIESLEADAKEAEEYREDLKREVIKLCGISIPELNADMFRNLTGKLSIQELKSFKQAFERKTKDFLTPLPQLTGEKQVKPTGNNKVYKI